MLSTLRMGSGPICLIHDSAPGQCLATEKTSSNYLLKIYKQIQQEDKWEKRLLCVEVRLEPLVETRMYGLGYFPLGHPLPSTEVPKALSLGNVLWWMMGKSNQQKSWLFSFGVSILQSVLLA